MTTGLVRADNKIDSLAVNQIEIVASHAINASRLETGAIKSIPKSFILLASKYNNNIYFAANYVAIWTSLVLRLFGLFNVDFVAAFGLFLLQLSYFHRHEFRSRFNHTALHLVYFLSLFFSSLGRSIA